MKNTLEFGRCIAVLNVVLFIHSANAVTTDKSIEESRVAWNAFLSQSCTTGQTEQTIRNLMDGKFRDVGFAQANDEVYRLLFLVDDFHQVEFAFNRDSRLLLTPTIEPKGQWLRMPNGEVQSIPNPLEAELRSKTEELALEYIVKHTDHNRDSLVVYCKRGTKAQTWDAVVIINSLQVGTPSYLLEVTDTGQVRETSDRITNKRNRP
ncbi:MAG: hypothetical protein RBS80_09410 [Thermoguttaceae bacterium]|nr:hypothetical protein [Thermoguttaceae bacterium]